MRIAYYIWEVFTPGGLQRITIDKINYLAQTGHEVLLITSYQQGREPFWQINDKVKHVDLDIDYQKATPIPNPLKRSLALMRIRREHKRRLEQTLVSHQTEICVNAVFCEEGSIFPALRDGSIKILESHGVKYALLPKFERKGKLAFLGKVQDWLRKRRYEAMPKHYDHFVVLSPSHLKQWEGYQNISAIPNMCSLPHVEPAKLENKIVVLMARLAPEKNIESMIRIWSRVQSEVPEWQLEIWGDGEKRQELQQQIHDLNLVGSVTLKGTTEDVQSVYLGASICCLTSKHEGFPMTLIEAKSCGLPLVSYACPVGPQDIIHDGEDGFLIVPEDEADFAQKLISLIKNRDLRQSFGAKSYKSSKIYTPGHIMTQWLDLFAQLLINKR